MKSVSKIILSSAVLMMAPSAFACDMHGGGMFWTPSGSWHDFKPKVTLIDPIYLDEDEDPFLDLDVPPAPKVRARPSFSEAATRASRSAKRKVMAESEQASQSARLGATDDEKTEPSLKPDTQTIR